MKIGIIGYGHVGKAMHLLFKEAIIYDKYTGIGSMAEVSQVDLAFICVPTPMRPDGSCDTSAVEEVIQQCTARLLVIRSTVYVGFTRAMMQKYQREIVFQPEYYGETAAHPYADLRQQTWLNFGGNPKGIKLAIQAYQKVVNSNVRIMQGTPEEMEMAKYMENSYFAVKVVFCNEFFDLCEKMGIDYNRVREAWISDPRIGNSHTFVYEDNRGFGGSCLPKDANSIAKQARDVGRELQVVESAIAKNKKFHQ